MKRVLLIALFLSVTLLVDAQWNTSNMLRRGQTALFIDDYISAIENFNNIIRIKPYLSEPYFFRGLAKLNLDDSEGAIKDFTEAIALDPNYFHAYTYRGIAFYQLGRYEESMQDYNTAMAINPSEAYLYANKAITEAAMGDDISAEKNFSKALMIDNKSLQAYLNRAIMRERMGNIAGALEDCNSAIQLNSFNVDAFGLRGYIKFQQGDHDEAIEDYNTALKISPENKRLLMSRAYIWYEMSRFNDALDDYTRILELDSTYTYAYYNRGLLRAEIGDYSRAIADLEEVLRMNRNNILIFFNLGLLRMEISDLDGAYYDFTESIALYPDFVKAYLARAAVSAEMHDYSAAEKDRHKATEIMDRYKRMKEGDKNALVDTTENFRRVVDFNSRTDRMREVIDGRLQDRDVIVELQSIFLVQYLPIDTLRKGKVQYFNKHVMAYNQAHNYDPALTISNKRGRFPDEFLNIQIDYLSNQVRKDRSNVDAFLLRGDFYLNRNEFSKAIDDFKAILERDPNDLFARFNLANTRLLMYDYIESIEDTRTGVIGKEEKVEKVVDYTLILNDYEKCLLIDPDFVFALFNIANIEVKRGDIDGAIDLYTKVLEKDKDIAEAYFNRGILRIFKGDKKEANSDLSKAGELGLTDSYSIIKRYCSEEE